MAYWSVDRIEDNLAVLINTEKETRNVPLTRFTGKIAAGEVVIQQEDGTFSKDSAKTAEKKRELFDLQKKIFSDW